MCSGNNSIFFSIQKQKLISKLVLVGFFNINKQLSQTLPSEFSYKCQIPTTVLGLSVGFMVLERASHLQKVGGLREKYTTKSTTHRNFGNSH